MLRLRCVYGLFRNSKINGNWQSTKFTFLVATNRLVMASIFSFPRIFILMLPIGIHKQIQTLSNVYYNKLSTKQRRRRRKKNETVYWFLLYALKLATKSECSRLPCKSNLHRKLEFDESYVDWRNCRFYLLSQRIGSWKSIQISYCWAINLPEKWTIDRDESKGCYHHRCRQSFFGLNSRCNHCTHKSRLNRF